MDDDMVLVNGLWCPAGDMQLITGLQADVKKGKRPVVDGRVAWRYDRIQAALDFIPPEKRRNCIDIGAHIGLWARWLAWSFQRTICFEPIPRHLACLSKNLFPEYGEVEIHPIALNEGLGRMIAMVPEIAVSGRSHVVLPVVQHVLDGEQDVGELVVAEVSSLDKFGFTDVDFIKIDVEGYESRVLEGAEATIKDNRPVIVIEQLGHEERYGEARNSALAVLKEWGMVELRPNMKGDYYMGWKD